MVVKETQPQTQKKVSHNISGRKQSWLSYRGLFCQVCVIKRILHYLANLSPCNPLGIALQSVIYVYWWPCGQEVGSKFTEVIRPLDTSRAGREKHISFLNGVFRSLELKVCCTFVTSLVQFCFKTCIFFSNSQPKGLQVWLEQTSEENISWIPHKLIYIKEHGFHKLLEFLAVYKSNYCCKFDFKMRMAVFLISLMPSATKKGLLCQRDPFGAPLPGMLSPPGISWKVRWGVGTEISI